MKFPVILLFVFCYAECRKTLVPFDKNANLAFINMEGGGGTRPSGNTKPLAPPQAPPPKPAAPAVQPTPANPAPKPAKPVVLVPAKPSAQPTQPTEIKPVPVNPAPVANPITTPGPGSVKQLITFYDSQGKGSPIRPYSYSQAVRQG